MNCNATYLGGRAKGKCIFVSSVILPGAKSKDFESSFTYSLTAVNQRLQCVVFYFLSHAHLCKLTDCKP